MIIPGELVSASVLSVINAGRSKGGGRPDQRELSGPLHLLGDPAQKPKNQRRSLKPNCHNYPLAQYKSFGQEPIPREINRRSGSGDLSAGEKTFTLCS